MSTSTYSGRTYYSISTILRTDRYVVKIVWLTREIGTHIPDQLEALQNHSNN